RPLCEVDALVLAQFSYLKFEGLIPGPDENKPSVSVEKLSENPDFDRLFSDVRYEKPNRALYEAMSASKRFSDMLINCHINIVEKERETQFSATSFVLNDNRIFIAFRGTDENIIGWKEDLNMTFMDPIPGQSLAAQYLNTVAGKFKGEFYVGGHSKGGNLSVYASMTCSKAIQDRIIHVYSMDGPGFRPELLRKYGYEAIKERTTKILPHSSLVGMLFENKMIFKVIESNSFGLKQHDTYTWLVRDMEFIEVEGLYRSRSRSDDNINEWICSLNAEERKAFIDTLFDVIDGSEVDNTIDLGKEWRNSTLKMAKKMKNLDPTTRDMMTKIIKMLFEIASEKLRRQMKADIEEAKMFLENVKITGKG
ncbi:MAG: DUF2974 domain-containing protein, partial [Lachnospiraceae bacterium]|nr:DUF2974 domain-containing protein [Lachnospiraceae bacterium]